MQKHEKWIARVDFSQRVTFKSPRLDFYMLNYYSRVSLRHNNSSKIPCTKPWFFPSKSRKFLLFVKVLKIRILGRFLADEKMHYLAIFYQIVLLLGRLTYLQRWFVSFNRFSFRGLWKWYNLKALGQRLLAWGSISLFAGFLEKENSLETLMVIFENVSPKGFFFGLNMKNFEISVLIFADSHS